MREAVLCCLILITGCHTLHREAHCNPFVVFPSGDIERVVLCEEESIYGLYARDPSDDGVYPVEFYLRPVWGTIRDRSDIARLHHALCAGNVTSGYPRTFSGCLCYQVFLNASNEVLAVTSIEAYECGVAILNGHMDGGVIRFGDRQGTLGLQSAPYCRIIHEFMQREQPGRMAELDRLYRDRGGIEKAIFDGADGADGSGP